MSAILGVGVPVPRGTLAGGFDVWLPLYVLLALVLIRFVSGMRLSIVTGIAALVGGTLWSELVDMVGVLPAAATAVLVAFAAGEVMRHLGRQQTDRE